MSEIAISASGAVAPAAVASAQDVVTKPSPFEYSVQSFFNWHKQLFEDILDWSNENCAALLASAMGIIATLVVCYFLRLLIVRVVIPLVEKKHRNAAEELRVITTPLVRLFFWAGAAGSTDLIPFTERVDYVVDRVCYVGFVLTLLNLFQHIAQSIASLMILRVRKKNPQNYIMNKLMLDLSMSIVRLLLWIFVTLFILQELFLLDVTGMVASAGILGLAIAYAARNTIGNVFGAFSILAGKTFKVGDWVKVDSAEGSVDQIGFRSIRIRTFDDARLIDIPNHLISDTKIENYSQRLFWREHFCFGLVYQTTPEQMALAKKILADIVEDLGEIIYQEKKLQFDFMLFDQCSLNIDGFVWFVPSDWLTMRHNRGVFNEEVLKRFNAAGLEFAYPTSTVYVEHADKN